MMKKILGTIYNVLGVDENIQLGSAFLICAKIEGVISGVVNSSYAALNNEYQRSYKRRGGFRYERAMHGVNEQLNFA